MAQERVSKPIAERRCPNCGTRIARDAESCFMCGYDLRHEPRRRRQVSWIDALLVLAVLIVIGFWWQAGNRPASEDATPTAAAGIPPDQIPFLTATPTPSPTPTPESAATPTPESPSGTVDHTVVSGETLLSIALDYGVTVDEIRQVNSIEGDLLHIGDKLTIPGQQAVLAPAAGATAAPRGPVSNFKYTVQDGDTIVSIATRLGSSVDEILQANNLGRSDLIRPGDELNIPVRQVPQEVLASTTTTQTFSIPGSTTAVEAADYPPPQLLAPADGATVAASEDVLLRWTSVDLLKPDEWYVVLLYPQSPGARRFPSIWTKTTSYRIGTEYAPEGGENADYSWQVSVVRVKNAQDGGYALEAASPASELRGFTWK